METEGTSKMRDRLSPKDQKTHQPSSKSRKETRAKTEEDAFNHPRPPTPSRASRGGLLLLVPTREEEETNDEYTPDNTKIPIETSPMEGEQNRRNKYYWHMQEMQFCIIKPKETAIRRGDPEETNKLLTEDKIKYGFMNPTYDIGLDDCKKSGQEWIC